ncbi:MAG: hypothetical protein KY468_12970, partial [Armatimonadetes bacterium]|nr:hypothetical protein [Armatimonadota bacterium]
MQREKFPDARLVLDLHQVGSASVMRGRGNQSRLPVRARLHRGQNRSIFMTDPRNVNLAGAYYLLPGDLIKGIIQYTEDGWILESFQRVATLSPPKVAALNVELSTDPNVTRPGEDVRMTLTVTNTGTAPAQFRFPSGQRSEFVVREGGREVWRWSRGRAFTQALSTLTLVPEEELRVQETWPGVDNTGQVVDPG